ncbi:IS30 family transposase [Piscinibacter sp.]|uniref:IS30 family transposase n=1 Tax=Piscinibacter sp. TaxID=1903157 RepID=UPI0039E6C48D
MQEGRTKYRQLQPEERMLIASMKLQGASLREISRKLARPASTISREVRRNGDAASDYASHTAMALHAQRRTAARPAAKLDARGVLWGAVLTMLNWRWSPQQIAATLRRVFPDEPCRHVSHESIYTAIYAHPRGELRRQLIACLRQGKSTRMPRSRGTDRRGQIPEMLSIHVRPPEVDDRVMPGHWEGDLIRGAGNKSAVGVLVERSSRLVLLARMPDATAESALAAFTAKLRQVAQPMRQTLTYDQGKEMARHAELAAATGVRVYFCDPHSPWQRPTCENTNGLLRQYLPKGTDLSIYTQDELDAIADSLNTRPRATHNWHNPLQVFAAMLQAASHRESAEIH